MKEQISVIADVLKNMSLPIPGDQIGFKDFDQRAGGFHPGELIVIASTVPQDKKFFVGNIVQSINVPVAVFPFRNRKTLIAPLVSYQNNISMQKALNSINSHCDVVDNSTLKLKGAQIYVDTRAGNNIDKVLQSIRNLKQKYGINGVLVDVIQNVNLANPFLSRKAFVNEAVNSLKRLAMELKIWIVALVDSSNKQKNKALNCINFMEGRVLLTLRM